MQSDRRILVRRELMDRAFSEIKAVWDGESRAVIVSHDRTGLMPTLADLQSTAHQIGMPLSPMAVVLERKGFVALRYEIAELSREQKHRDVRHDFSPTLACVCDIGLGEPFFSGLVYRDIALFLMEDPGKIPRHRGDFFAPIFAANSGKIAYCRYLAG